MKTLSMRPMHGERSCIANQNRFELIQHALSPSKGLVKKCLQFHSKFSQRTGRSFDDFLHLFYSLWNASCWTKNHFKIFGYHSFILIQIKSPKPITDRRFLKAQVSISTSKIFKNVLLYKGSGIWKI